MFEQLIPFAHHSENFLVNNGFVPNDHFPGARAAHFWEQILEIIRMVFA
jgi:hypothetical protein